MPRTSTVDPAPAVVRAVAASASVDPRTVTAYLAGKAQVSTTIARIVAALIAAGRADLVRRPEIVVPVSALRASRKRSDKRAVA